jgi:hypothetical protein
MADQVKSEQQQQVQQEQGETMKSSEQTQVTGEKKFEKDGLNIVRQDHARFKELANSFLQCTDLSEKGKLVKNLVREVSQTNSAVERYLFPLIQSNLKAFASDMIYHRVRMDGKLNNELLKFLERFGPQSHKNREEMEGKDYTDEEIEIFENTREKFCYVFLNYIEKLEEWVLSRLDSALDSHEKEKLYDDLIWAKRHGPTHAHSTGSSSSISKILHPVVGVADRIRDSFSS